MITLRIIAYYINKILFSCKEFTIFIIQTILYPKKTQFKRSKRKDSVIIGNGPSAMDEFDYISNKDCNIICMNDFATSKYFFLLKPDEYFIIDPFFFKESERVRNIFNALNKVTWHIRLCVPYKYSKEINGRIINKQIRVTGLNINSLNLKGRLSYFLYSNGQAMPKTQNVAIACLMYSIISGSAYIELFGMEHNWPNLMTLNESKKLCLKRTHFYDNDELILSPWRKPDNSIWTVSESLSALSKMFQSYELIATYAKVKGIKIINKTKNTLIDAF